MTEEPERHSSPSGEDRGDGGPLDISEIAPQAGGGGVARVDFGSLQLPLPEDGTLVPPEDDERVSAVHVMTPDGRLSVSALAAPRLGKLWPDLCKEINESLREGGARVRSEQGEWGRELQATTGGASSLFIGIDGEGWMVYGVATGPTERALHLAEKLHQMLRGTIVVRGNSPYPVRTVLPLALPEGPIPSSSRPTLFIRSSTDSASIRPIDQQNDPAAEEAPETGQQWLRNEIRRRMETNASHTGKHARNQEGSAPRVGDGEYSYATRHSAPDRQSFDGDIVPTDPEGIAQVVVPPSITSDEASEGHPTPTYGVSQQHSQDHHQESIEEAALWPSPQDSESLRVRHLWEELERLEQGRKADAASVDVDSLRFDLEEDLNAPVRVSAEELASGIDSVTSDLNWALNLLGPPPSPTGGVGDSRGPVTPLGSRA